MATTFSVTTAVFAALWLILTGGDPASWLVGLPAIVMANLTVFWLGVRLPKSLRPMVWGGFALFFVRESIVAGFDVAWRIVQPDVKIDPAIVTYRSRLESPTQRAWLMTLITMLPGTLSVGTRGREISIHVLDMATYQETDIVQLENRISSLSDNPVEVPA